MYSIATWEMQPQLCALDRGGPERRIDAFSPEAALGILLQDDVCMQS